MTEYLLVAGLVGLAAVGAFAALGSSVTRSVQCAARALEGESGDCSGAAGSRDAFDVDPSARGGREALLDDMIDMAGGGGSDDFTIASSNLDDGAGTTSTSSADRSRLSASVSMNRPLSRAARSLSCAKANTRECTFRPRGRPIVRVVGRVRGLTSNGRVMRIHSRRDYYFGGCSGDRCVVFHKRNFDHNGGSFFAVVPRRALRFRDRKDRYRDRGAYPYRQREVASSRMRRYVHDWGRWANIIIRPDRADYGCGDDDPTTNGCGAAAFLNEYSCLGAHVGTEAGAGGRCGSAIAGAETPATDERGRGYTSGIYRGDEVFHFTGLTSTTRVGHLGPEDEIDAWGTATWHYGYVVEDGQRVYTWVLVTVVPD